MSSDETPHTPAPQDRRGAVREKAQQVQAQQSKAMVVRRVSVVAIIVAFIAALAVVVTWVVASAAGRPQLNPANMTDDGIVVTAAGSTSGDVETGELPEASASATPTPDPSATETAPPVEVEPVEIRVYIDYLSTGSSQFQLANATQLSQWVEEGAASLMYHPIALLTAKSNGTKYSLRAANAAACVASHSPDTFFRFNHELLATQPEEGTDGHTDVQLADLAIAVGADEPKIVRACVEGEDFAPWVQDATERAVSGALPGTDDVTLTGAPMVLVNGIPYLGSLDDPAEFAQFVLTISSDTYYKESASPTPTPTPTPTPSATK